MRHRQSRPESKQHSAYIQQVIAALQNDPSKLSIIRANLAYYKEQQFLKKGFLLAIERFDWVFEASDNVDAVCSQIMADDYIGKRLRRYPLLYKGILS